MLGVDLDNMPVGIADVDLRESGGGTGLKDHAVRIVDAGILAVAFRAKEIYGRVVIRHAHRKVNVTRVERLVTKSGTLVNDQVKLLRIAQTKPRARKIEWRPRDLFERQDLAVEPSRPVQVGNGESDVVNSGDLHTTTSNPSVRMLTHGGSNEPRPDNLLAPEPHASAWGCYVEP